MNEEKNVKIIALAISLSKEWNNCIDKLNTDVHICYFQQYTFCISPNRLPKAACIL